MNAALSLPHPPCEPSSEQRFVLTDVTWEQYETFTASLGDRPDLRVFFLEGTLEIMSPSPEHELSKKAIARLVEAYAEEMGIELVGIGSATFRNPAEERGAEPDECWCLGELRAVPDIVLEVVVSHGGLDRLDIYAGLGVREVWFFKRGRFSFFRRTGESYTSIQRSILLPGLDFELLSRYIDPAHPTQAVRAFRSAMRAR